MKNKKTEFSKTVFEQQNTFNNIADTDSETCIPGKFGFINKTGCSKKLNDRFIFVFDLDNTLVKTNRANNMAYKEAIRTIVGMDIPMKHRRFTRSNLLTVLPNLAEPEFNAIIKLKEELYTNHLQETTLNRQLLKILRLRNHVGDETILLTECSKTRAKQVCDYHSLTPFFDKSYYKDDMGSINKYQYLKGILSSLGSVILFENEQTEIKRAKQYGIPENQIITIKF